MIINPLETKSSGPKENTSLILEEFGTEEIVKDLSAACLVERFKWSRKSALVLLLSSTEIRC